MSRFQGHPAAACLYPSPEDVAGGGPGALESAGLCHALSREKERVVRVPGLY